MITHSKVVRTVTVHLSARAGEGIDSMREKVRALRADIAGQSEDHGYAKVHFQAGGGSKWTIARFVKAIGAPQDRTGWDSEAKPQDPVAIMRDLVFQRRKLQSCDVSDWRDVLEAFRTGAVDSENREKASTWISQAEEMVQWLQQLDSGMAAELVCTLQGIKEGLDVRMPATSHGRDVYGA
jgi:hypothetical protein